MREARVPRRALAVVALLAALAACGTAPADDGKPYDDADVTFASEMVPHHEQAVAMAELAPARASSPQVKEIAAQITAEQVPEIAQLQWMLSAWGQPAAPTNAMDMPGAAGMPGMDRTSAILAAMPGMMTDKQMAALGAASGPAFDRTFLQMMIEHHQGGVAMAHDELADGRDQDATQMAQNISDAQLAGITLMRQLLTHP
jgi:uncharacterized protein (DUF305 family)